MPSTRPVTMSGSSMIATPHYLASFVGAKVLSEGGNAIDAAVAANAVLGVVYPHNTGLGGDSFWIIHHAKTGKSVALNASGRAPYAATAQFFKEKGMTRIPLRGILPVTVPGVVDGWCTVIEKFGTLPLSRLLQPAIHYAEHGFPVSEKLSRSIEENVSVLSEHPTSARVFLKNGTPAAPGQILIQEHLARSLRLIAEQGREAFYSGDICRSILKLSRQVGGFLSEEDFAAHKSDWVEPISTTYRDLHVYAVPPNSQGITSLQELNLAEGFDPRSLGYLSPDLIHVMVETKKLAFADRDGYVSDPATTRIPVGELLSKQYARGRRRLISPDRAAKDTVSNRPAQGDTVYVTAVDAEGNAVSVNESIYFSFGSGMVAGDTGILLQNRGAYFSLEEKHVNKIEPHKRTLHTLSPLMMFKDDELVMAFGTMGGDGQPQTHLQLVLDIVDFGMNAQEAIEAPRWLHGRTEIGQAEDTLSLEEGISPDVVRELERRGHKTRVLERWDETFGHAQAILVNKTNKILTGGADPRGDGAAIGT